MGFFRVRHGGHDFISKNGTIVDITPEPDLPEVIDPTLIEAPAPDLP